MLVPLAAEAATGLLPRILPALLGLLALVVVGAVVVSILRRSVRSDSGGPAGFSLQDLRDLHARGELTDEEFARARDAMIGRLTAPSDGEKATEPPGEGR